MPLVKACCTNCGAALEVDNNKEAAICPYCSTAYIVEKAINKYVMNVQNLNADVVNVILPDKDEQEFKNAEALIKFEDYDGALKIYKKLAKTYANDPRTWNGLLLAETCDKGDYLGTIEEANTLFEYYKRLKSLDPKMASNWKDYMTGIKQEYQEIVRLSKERIKQLEKKNRTRLIVMIVFIVLTVVAVPIVFYMMFSNILPLLMFLILIALGITIGILYVKGQEFELKIANTKQVIENAREEYYN